MDSDRVKGALFCLLIAVALLAYLLFSGFLEHFPATEDLSAPTSPPPVPISGPRP